ncbi:MAG: hypothetical protein GEU68_13260 [Actinobacteria bacterium]|nr:hypothetical protein [Actinomycetota bacterium]
MRRVFSEYRSSVDRRWSWHRLSERGCGARIVSARAGADAVPRRADTDTDPLCRELSTLHRRGYVDSRGIEVVNIFGRVRIPWAVISDFTLGAYGRTPQMGYAVLQDGSNRPLHGIRGAGSGMALSLTARSAERLIDELNELKVLNQRGSGQL